MLNGAGVGRPSAFHGCSRFSARSSSSRRGSTRSTTLGGHALSPPLMLMHRHWANRRDKCGSRASGSTSHLPIVVDFAASSYCQGWSASIRQVGHCRRLGLSPPAQKRRAMLFSGDAALRGQYLITNTGRIARYDIITHFSPVFTDIAEEFEGFMRRCSDTMIINSSSKFIMPTRSSSYTTRSGLISGRFQKLTRRCLRAFIHGFLHFRFADFSSISAEPRFRA